MAVIDFLPEGELANFREAGKRWSGEHSAASTKPQRRERALSAEEKRISALLSGSGGYTIGLKSTHAYSEFRAALSRQIVDAGGSLVAPPTIEDAVELSLLYSSAMRRVSDIVRDDASAEHLMPMMDDATNEGVLVPESTAPGDLDIALAQLHLGHFRFNSKRVKVPAELIQDAIPSFLFWLNTGLARRIGRIQNRLFTVGNGVTQPKGVVPSAVKGRQAKSSTDLVGDDLLALIASVDAAYRENAVFMMSDLILLVVQNMKDNAGRYLFPEACGQPAMIRGFRVAINNHFAARIVSGERTVLFGDFSRYKIRDRGQVYYKAYTEAVGLAENDLRGIEAEMRSDGALMDAGQGPVKCIEH
jgi:HK97 family phage major capsid protein